MRRILLIGLLAGCRAPSDVDTLAASAVSAAEGGGLAVAVIRKGRIIVRKGYGWADEASRTPVSPETVFDLASVAKQFTGMAALILAERGQLDLKADARGRLPELPAFDTRRPIRVEDLARHFSGLPEYPERAVQRMEQGQPPSTSKEVLAWLSRRRKLERPAGSRWEYSNVGYFLLAKTVERASGRTFASFLSEEVFRAAGMKTARVLDRPDAVIPGRATGYCLKARPCRYDDARPGAANVFASLDDMIAWDRALAGGVFLKPELLVAAVEGGRLDSGIAIPYGFGWQVSRVGGRRAMWHDSDFIGASAYIVRFLDDDLTVILLSNKAGVATAELAERAAKLYY